MEKSPKPDEDNPLMQALLGQSMVHVGIQSGDLSLVRDGKKHQVEAAARGAKPKSAGAFSTKLPPR